ncbi:MAG: hypothetical protein GQ574_16515 [Crocinitomix sp.]|nr:hypothetical protein [Crocinitomix sp.]
MTKNDYSTTYRFKIPWKTVVEYQGEDCYEETLEDHFRPILCEPMRQKGFAYKFNFNAFHVKDGVGMELIIYNEEIDNAIIIENGIRTGLLNGLIITKLNYEKWEEIYNATNLDLNSI